MATRTWIGSAIKTRDTYTVTIANTWATSDTVTLSCNGKDLVVTIGSLTTTAQVATTLKQAFESEAFTDTTASCVPTGGGTTIGEFSQFTATVSGSVVTLTADTTAAGVAFPTITATEVTAGDGTATAAQTVTATGPAHYGNVDNWAEGAAATTGDDMIWDRPASILYGIDQNTVTLTSLTIGPRVTSAVYAGLPFRNTTNSSYPYEEGLEDYFKISATTVNCYGASGRIKLNVGSNACTANIYSTGTSTDTGRAAFQFLGTHASNVVNAFGGDVGIAANNGESATVATLRVAGATVTCGSSATLTTVNKTSGTLTLESSTTTLTNEAGSLTIRGGTHTLLTVDSGTVTITGTTTITNLRQNGGTITIGPNVTISTAVVQTGGTLTSYAAIPTITTTAGTASINAGNITTATINGGSFNYDGTGTCTTLRIGDATVTTGPNVTLTTVDKLKGTLTCSGGITTLISNAGTTTVQSGNITDCSILGGTFEYEGSGTITSMTAENCTLDFSGNTAACTVTTFNITARPVRLKDPSDRVTWTNGLPSGLRIDFLAA